MQAASSCDIEATREASVELRGVKPSPEEERPISVIGARNCGEGVGMWFLSDVCVLIGGELGGSVGEVCGELLVEELGS